VEPPARRNGSGGPLKSGFLRRAFEPVLISLEQTGDEIVGRVVTIRPSRWKSAWTDGRPDAA